MDQGVIKQVDSVLARYNNDREALVEILRDLSKEVGYVSRDAFAVLAEKLDLPASAVYGVASFYSMIETEPHGQHVVRFCQDAPCHVAGGREVWNALEAALGIKFGETTPDGQWTLMITSCIGLCAVGPVMLVDEDLYGNLTPEKIPEILARYADAGGAA